MAKLVVKDTTIRNVVNCGLDNYFLRRRLRCVGVMFSSEAIAPDFPSRNKCLAFIIMSKLTATFAKILPKVGVDVIDI